MSFRILVGGRLNQAQLPTTGAPAPTIFHAVVLDIINDPKALTVEEKTDLKRFVSNPEFVDMMPQNTIIARIISNQQNATDTSPTLVYPFYQSHIMLPLQAGEQVMVIYDDYSYMGGILGRYITRTSEGYMVEDPNFTHGDRRFDPSNNPAQQDAAQQRNQRNNQTSPPPPSFPNGSGTPESYTLIPTRENPNVNPFDTIASDSTAARLHSFEPVPRWTKRPQELILQGMNNSLIMLGQDRTGPATRPESNPQDKLKYSGTIDLVAGRGRVPLETNENTAPSGKDTSPLTVQNSRNNLETDKTPFLRNRQPNLREGDPNFQTDAARVYVSMNTAGDTNFKLLHGNNGINYPDNTLKPTEQPNGPNENVGSSYIISKADHLRFIARKSTDPQINGTILFVKEGSANQDLAFFYVKEDGKMQLEAPEIHLGQSTGKGEPYIKWSKFQETVNKLHEEIDIVKSALNSLIQKLTIAAPTSVCSPFSPDPAWTSLVPQIQPIQPQMETDLSTKRQQTNQSVTDAKSLKIFGS